MLNLKEINHAKILSKRIKNEINNRNIDNALYLTDTFIVLFPRHQPETTEITKSYAKLSQTLIKESKLKEAENIILKALLLDPDNPKPQDILIKIKKHQYSHLKKSGQTTKSLAYEFIEKYYPKELNIFDIAWRVFKDITLKDYKQEAVAGTIGIVGEEAAEAKTPKAIIVLSRLHSQDIANMSQEKIKTYISDYGNKIGCSQKLIEQLTSHVLEQ